MAKPSSGTPLNTGHALYTNLANVWALLEGAGGTTADSKGSNTGTLNSGAWSTDANGDPCWLITAANASPISLASTVTITTGTDMSIAWRAKNTNADFQGMVLGDNTTTSDFLWHADGSYLDYRASNGIDYQFAGVTSFTTEANYLLTADNGNLKVRLYKNGTEINAPGLTATAGSLGLIINTLGNGYTGTGFSLVGKVSYIYVWTSRVLTGTDAGTLNTDPYAFFQAGSGGALRVGMNPAASLA